MTDAKEMLGCHQISDLVEIDDPRSKQNTLNTLTNHDYYIAKVYLEEQQFKEMDLKWQVVMISMRMKKFYKKTGRKLQFDAKELVGFDKTKVECYNCHKTRHFARECRIKGNQDNWVEETKDGSELDRRDSKALVTIDGEGVDWTNHSEDEDYALMACNSSDSDTEGNYMPSGPDIEVDYSQFTYGPKQTQPKCQPKVWSDAPIIEEYESDSEDEYVSIPIKEKETPSFANQQVKTPRETIKNQFTHSQKPKVDKKELGYGFTGNKKGKLLLSPQQVVIGDHKDTTGTMSPNTMVDPVFRKLLNFQRSIRAGLKPKQVGHMTGNKAYLAEFQDFNGGPVAFGGSKGYITERKATQGLLDVLNSVASKGDSRGTTVMLETPHKWVVRERTGTRIEAA
ncbi:ribonuclease H-like domain-containing protein [Tanacetum coccineum]